MTEAPSELPFDRVVVEDASGKRELSAMEFLRLPLSDRIRCIIERTVRFYRDGEEVDRYVAIDSVRRARVAS